MRVLSALIRIFGWKKRSLRFCWICVLEICMEFWLVTTDHLSTRIWFRDDEDYRMGMNLVAILACVLGVQVLAFELMSNHVHFVLHCTHEQAKHFCDEYKKRYSQYLNKKYGTKDFLRKVAVDILLVDGMDESLERAIAYVQMNCVAARICLSPTGYPWGTGNAFFKSIPVKGRRIDMFSKRSLRLLLHSTEELPPHLLVGEEGYILPECYVQVQWVESIFRTPQRMDFFLLDPGKNDPVRRVFLQITDPDRHLQPAVQNPVHVFHGLGIHSLFGQAVDETLNRQQLQILHPDVSKAGNDMIFHDRFISFLCGIVSEPSPAIHFLCADFDRAEEIPGPGLHPLRDGHLGFLKIFAVIDRGHHFRQHLPGFLLGFCEQGMPFSVDRIPGFPAVIAPFSDCAFTVSTLLCHC